MSPRPLDIFTGPGAVGSIFNIHWGPIGVQFRRKRIAPDAYRRLMLPTHEQIASDLIRKPVTPLGADRRHLSVIEVKPETSVTRSGG